MVTYSSFHAFLLKKWIFPIMSKTVEFGKKHRGFVPQYLSVLIGTQILRINKGICKYAEDPGLK